MALLDIVFYPKDLGLYEARGNIGTLLDIEVLGPSPGVEGTKINEEVRGNIGTLLDVMGIQKIFERPGAGGGETSHTFLC
jgi:hypothetical protein